MKHALCILLTLCCGCASSHQSTIRADKEEAARYPIKLHRASNVGDKTLRTTEMISERTVLFRDTSGQDLLPPERTKTRVHFAAAQEVQQVNDNGIPVVIRYELREVQVQGGDEPESLFAPGTIIILRRDAEGGQFGSEGGELTEEQRSVLEMVLASGTPTRSDDEVFGTPQPQMLGASWPIHAKVAATDLRASGIDVEADQINGHTSLASVQVVDGVECLEITAEFFAQRIQPTELPQGTHFTEGELQSTFAGVFPTDLELGRLSDVSTMKARFVLSQNTTDSTFVIEMTMRQEQSSRYEPLP